MNGTDYIPTVVIGGGQAGLSVGYHLKRLRERFVILDASPRIGDAWRGRWDSLRLFTPARYDGLDGMPFPAPPHYFPTKDEMADYLAEYARKFDLPVSGGQRVERLSQSNGHFLVGTAEDQIEADNVVVAMSSWQKARLPDLSRDLDESINQIHGGDYKNPGQLIEGPVLVIGAGNSGAEIALDVVTDHPTFLAGRDTGHVPFDIDGSLGPILIPFVLRFLFHRVLTVKTPIGRKARPELMTQGMRLVRTKPRDLIQAGVDRVPRVAAVEDGRPVLEDGRVIEATNVIWCTGFDPGFSWIDMPIHGDHEVRHQSGVSEDVPGLYFVGLEFLHSFSSSEVHGVGRDAARIARLVAARTASRRSTMNADISKPG